MASISVADLVINEVHYDPPGPDSGYEFIEIFNPAPESVSLAGVRVLFVNGSSPGDGDEIWTGEPAAVLPSGGFFVLGGQFVESRDRTLDLALQNGDEAVELWRENELLDVLAWGSLSGLGEGPPFDGGVGRSIGRVPDGRDSDSNALDFRELPEPTPGSANLAEDGFTLVAWWPEPVWREDPGDVLVHLEILPTGWGELQTGVLAFDGQVFQLRADPSDTLRFTTRLNCSPGPVPVDLRLGVDEPDLRPVGPAELWCGIHDLAIVEVQARPADGEPEWIELFNASERPVELAGWSLRDRGGTARRLVDDGQILAGERIVFCADASGLRRRYPGSPARFLEPASGWPTLNDTSPGGGVAADSLHLLAPGGLVVDLVTWSSDEIEERGRPLQRGSIREGVPSIWMPAIGGAGPGYPADEETRIWPAVGIECGPDPFTPDADGVDDELEVLLVGDWASARAAIFDLQGDLVRELDLLEGGARHAARWDGTDARGRPVAAGAWVLVVDAEDMAGVPARIRRVVGLGRRQ